MNNKDLDFTKSVTEKEIAKAMSVPIYSLEKIDEDDDHRIFGRFPNMFLSDDLDIHEGKYALNIKQHHWNNQSIPDEDVADCIDHVTDTFFNLAEKICKSFGFSGFTLGGRSGGWMYLIEDTKGRYSAVEGILEDILSFDEYFLQEKIFACFNLIKDIQKDLIMIYTRALSFEDLHHRTERYIYG
jgi:hypothetical protein